MKTKQSLITYILLIIGSIIVVNLLSESFFVRLDFTEDKRFTLSNATKNILDDLDEPVTITTYFTEGLPPQLDNSRRDFMNLLVEYASASDRMVDFEFIDPSDDEDAKMEAMQAGVRPLQIGVREKDKATQIEVFLSAIIKVGTQSEVILIARQAGMSIEPMSVVQMEHALTTRIKKLSVIDKPKIAFLQGHGEPSLSAMWQVQEDLAYQYQAEPVTLNDSTFELMKYKTVAIVAPTDTFPESHIRQLDAFLAEGKSIFISMKRTEADLSNQPPTAKELNTGLEAWLAGKGIVVEKNLVTDKTCGAISVMEQQAFFRVQRQIEFPYFPILKNFSEHPITEGLEAVIMQFASSITFTGDSTVKFTPLVTTSGSSGTQQTPVYFNVQKEWSASDFPLSNLTVAAVAEGKLSGDQTSRIAIVSTGDLAINGEGQQRQQINPDNVSLMVNAIDYLSDDTGLIELRTKGVTWRPIDEDLEDGTKMFLKYFNFLLPILLIIVFGIVRMQIKRNQRVKRMEEYYV